MFPGTQHPLVGGEVLVAPRVGRAAVYAEAVCSPTTVLCPSVAVLRSVHLPACLSACLSGRGRRLTVAGCGAGVGIAAMAAEVNEGGGGHGVATMAVAVRMGAVGMTAAARVAMGTAAVMEVV